MDAQREASHAVSARFDRRSSRIIRRAEHGRSGSHFQPIWQKDWPAPQRLTLPESRSVPPELGLHWPRLDADLYVPSLLQGMLGSKSWMARQLGEAGGRTPEQRRRRPRRVKTGARGGRPGRLPMGEILRDPAHRKDSIDPALTRYSRPVHIVCTHLARWAESVERGFNIWLGGYPMDERDLRGSDRPRLRRAGHVAPWFRATVGGRRAGGAAGDPASWPMPGVAMAQSRPVYKPTKRAAAARPLKVLVARGRRCSIRIFAVGTKDEDGSPGSSRTARRLGSRQQPPAGPRRDHSGPRGRPRLAADGKSVTWRLKQGVTWRRQATSPPTMSSSPGSMPTIPPRRRSPAKLLQGRHGREDRPGTPCW